MRILVLTWPTNQRDELMTNARGDLLCPAIDGLVDQLVTQGHTLVCVNVAADCFDFDPNELALPAWASGMQYVRWSQVQKRDFDLVWHGVKVPTPPPAVDAIGKIMQDLPPEIRVLNPVQRMKDFTKRTYLTVLQEHNVGAEILDSYPGIEDENGRFAPKKCHASCQGTFVALDKRAIRVPMHNKGLGIRNPEGGITLRYYDTAGWHEPGQRTFFRLPFAAGKALEGFRYFCPENIVAPKSGNAKRYEPFSVNYKVGRRLCISMHKLGVDIAHLEGIELKDGTVRIFDVNPFATAIGRTLTPISQRIARHITQVMDL